MDKTYSPGDIEQTWYQKWEQSGCFSPKSKPDESASPYCIAIPPPNVTGSLHMGHAFQDTIMDTLIRYHRMQGHNTLWQVGTDHAGIATQMLVERQLTAQGIQRSEIGREAFLEKIWQWKAESGGNITRQLRRMGASVDWTRERFTMDEGLSKAVQKVFIDLYNENLIYRGKRLVNWDPTLHTALSDLEVLNEEENGYFWHFQYPLIDKDGKETGEMVEIATTRPETMLGDTAVAVHPDDERYQHLIGHSVKLPLSGRHLPIIADEYVEPEKGTGCVKITPAHDFNDFEMGARHNLETINIFNKNAALNENVPPQYQGLDRFEARKQIIKDLDALGLLTKVEPHRLKIPRGDRSGVVIEPYITEQWYVKTTPLAEPAIKAVEEGDIEFVPKSWENTYFAWMRDIKDWCISRQLWWGHRIPAWFDESGKIYVGESEATIREKHQLPNSVALRQDEDVLDTWFSSALWTFSTLGWPEEEEALKAFHPTAVLVTGFDIIFFWVARMIMMTLKFKKEIPFKTVYVHGLVRDADGQKMSKSKGNVLDPIDIIDGISLEELVTKRTSNLLQPHVAEKIKKQTHKHFSNGIASYGTDALRFTFLSLASTGRDINFDINRLEGYRNFCNKLWNAARFVLMNTDTPDFQKQLEEQGQPENQHFHLIDNWIESELQTTIEKIDNAIQQYRFDHATSALYDFIWHQYCDWYLELSKIIINKPNKSNSYRFPTQYKLLSVLERLLRIAHPMIPYITEEIWQTVSEKLTSLKITTQTDDSTTLRTIMIQQYPLFDSSQFSETATQTVEWIKQFVTAIRNIRGEMNISPGKKISVLLKGGSSQDINTCNEYSTILRSLAKLSNIDWLSASETAPASSTAFIGSLELHCPMADLIDKENELKRLKKEVDKTTQDIQQAEGKLANKKFTDKAPAAVIEKEQGRLTQHRQTLSQLEEQFEKITAL